MATNKVSYVGNLYGAPGPMKFKGKFQAGASQAIKKGELLKLVSTNWVPLTDTAMSAIVGVSDCEIASGDLAGYHDIIVPRPGDVFEAAIATAAATAPGTALYCSDSQTVAASGSNILGAAVDDSLIPTQGFQSRSPSPDAGTTLTTSSTVRFTIKAAASYYAALQT